MITKPISLSSDISTTTTGFLLVAVLVLTGCVPSSHELIVTNGEYGTVFSVSECRTYKSLHRCRVETDLAVYASMHVSDFPDGTLSSGDKIFFQNVNNGISVRTSMCKGNRCLGHSVCYWWMPCFK